MRLIATMMLLLTVGGAGACGDSKALPPRADGPGGTAGGTGAGGASGGSAGSAPSGGESGHDAGSVGATAEDAGVDA